MAYHSAFAPRVLPFESICICCTLRADLLEEVAQLAETKQFEYVEIAALPGGNYAVKHT
jgi:G3E family GTPase